MHKGHKRRNRWHSYVVVTNTFERFFSNLDEAYEYSNWLYSKGINSDVEDL